MAAMTSPSPAADAPAVGIIIRSGAPAPKPARFWAYLWAADEENSSNEHWHQRVPTERAA
jgi:hypothetical protein